MTARPSPQIGSRFVKAHACSSCSRRSGARTVRIARAIGDGRLGARAPAPNTRAHPPREIDWTKSTIVARTIWAVRTTSSPPSSAQVSQIEQRSPFSRCPSAGSFAIAWVARARSDVRVGLARGVSHLGALLAGRFCKFLLVGVRVTAHRAQERIRGRVARGPRMRANHRPDARELSRAAERPFTL